MATISNTLTSMPVQIRYQWDTEQDSLPAPMPVHVLLFDAGSDSEGIHSLEVSGRTVVLLFEDRDDAERYAGLLEAQDFPMPTVDTIDREEMEHFCSQAGYEVRFVPAGFLPQSAEDRLMIAPPEQNLDVTDWKEQAEAGVRGQVSQGDDGSESDDRLGRSSEPITSSDPALEAFRRQLEGLL